MKIARKPIAVLARKELSMMLNSPATYVICVIFLLISGWLFASLLFPVNQSTLDSFIRPLPLIFTFLIPALTMRSFSEEFKGGTIEYLATLPIQDYEIVLGKYIAVLGFLVILLIFTLVYPLILLIVGQPDIGQMFCGYAAVLGLGAFFAAIGLWASTLTRNQVVAFIISFFVCFSFFLLDHMADFAPGFLSSILRAFSVGEHFDSLARGVLDTRDIIYWLGGSLFFLSATLASLNSRRWR